MADARELIAGIRTQLKAVEGRLSAHPYHSAIEEGRITKEKLHLFAGEQYNIINSDLRSMALMVSRQGRGDDREYFVGALQGETAARDALVAFARALEMSEHDLQAYELMYWDTLYEASI